MNTPIVTGVASVIIFIVGFGIGYFAGLNTESTTYKNISPMVPSFTQEPTQEIQATRTPENTITTMVQYMSEDQKKMLRTFGIDTEKITPTMVQCAETNIGSERITAIKDGAEITLSEKMKLLDCYK